MHSNTALLVATSFLTLGAQAACTIKGFSESNCSGASGGNEIPISSGGVCVTMSGRKSFTLSKDCHDVQIDYWDATGCHGGHLNQLHHGSGCWLVAAASVNVKTV